MFKPISNSARLFPNTFKLKIVSSYQAFDVAITLDIRQKCDLTSSLVNEYIYVIEEAEEMSCKTINTTEFEA